MNIQSKQKITICHLSDFHLPLTSHVPIHMLVGKRIMGLANLKFLRQNTHQKEAFESLLAHASKQKVDLFVFTGDLSNLALNFEFNDISTILSKYGFTPSNMLIMPGNHDRYTALADLRDTFEQNMANWLPPHFSRKTGYPITRILKPIAIFALDTAVWRGPLRAAGKICSNQIERLVTTLNNEAKNLVPVIAMHHPPFRLKGSSFKNFRDGLNGQDKLIAALCNTNNNINATIIHGHTHVQSINKVNNINIIGVPSASNNIGITKKQLAYHLYTFNEKGLKQMQSIRHWPNEPVEKKQFETNTFSY